MFDCFLMSVRSSMNCNGRGGGENIRGVEEGKTTISIYCMKNIYSFFLNLFYFTENRFSPRMLICNCSVSLGSKQAFGPFPLHWGDILQMELHSLTVTSYAMFGWYPWESCPFLERQWWGVNGGSRGGTWRRSGGSNRGQDVKYIHI